MPPYPITGGAQHLDQTRMGLEPIHPLRVLQHLGHAHATVNSRPNKGLSVGRPGVEHWCLVGNDDCYKPWAMVVPYCTVCFTVLRAVLMVCMACSKQADARPKRKSITVPAAQASRSHVIRSP
jgi:hypothetical protein